MTVNAGTGTFGNTGIGTGNNYQDVSNTIRGSPYVAPATGTLQSITAYIYVTSTSRNIQAAIYTTSGTLIGTSNVVSQLSGGAQSATFTLDQTKSNCWNNLCASLVSQLGYVRCVSLL